MASGKGGSEALPGMERALGPCSPYACGPCRGEDQRVKIGMHRARGSARSEPGLGAGGTSVAAFGETVLESPADIVILLTVTRM